MRSLLLIPFLCVSLTTFSQYDYFQYFDGADTSALNSVKFYKDSLDPDNIWQVGPPQKNIFSSASTVPNALVTDTIAPYPLNNYSTVYSKLELPINWYSIWAVQWRQKIDFGQDDGGKFEFSVDSVNWQNAFYSPYTYNFFGFDMNNMGFVEGEDAFVGTDTTWKNVWFCFDLSWATLQENLFLRYTLVSDTSGGVADSNEGWLIDDMISQPTWVHTLNEIEPEDYMSVYPNPANERINITTEKKTEFHIIEDLSMYNAEGKRVRHFENVPVKFFIDVEGLPNGIYEVKARTNFEERSFKVIVQH